ncbi:MAG TPA: VOC family protein [Abditibacterium sp.]|jgi:catechol 2,3-dioxygenase-like lactoylglutathione lyase family enzyme
MKILHLHHILLPVSDVEASAQFYEALGMERVSAISGAMRWMQFGPNQLHLWPNDRAHTYNGWQQEPSPHFAVVGDDIFEFERRIPELGGRVLQAPGKRPNGTWYLFALDPDGNRFEIMQL